MKLEKSHETAAGHNDHTNMSYLCNKVGGAHLKLGQHSLCTAQVCKLLRSLFEITIITQKNTSGRSIHSCIFDLVRLSEIIPGM